MCESTAERIKKQYGVAQSPADGVGETIYIKGRDLVNGVPKEITIKQGQIAEALSEPIGTIVEGVRIALENTAPTLHQGFSVAGEGLANASLRCSSTFRTRLGLPRSKERRVG